MHTVQREFSNDSINVNSVVLVYKIPYNIKRLESIGLVELFGEYSSFGDRLLLSENMFAELTDNGLLFADVGSGLFKGAIQPQENFEKQSG